MSRRARSRRGAKGRVWLIRGLAAVALLVLVAAGGVYGWVRSFLRSEEFRVMMSRQVSKAVEVEGEFSPFRWQGLAVDSESFSATGEGPVRSMRLEGLHTEIGLSGLMRGVWKLKDSELKRVEIELDARKPAEPGPELSGGSAPPEPERRASKKTRSWLPTEVELDGLQLQDLTVRAEMDPGPASAEGLKIALEPAGAKGAYHAAIDGGVVRLPWQRLPRLDLGRVRLRYQDGNVYLTEAEAGIFSRGRLQTTGEWQSGTGQFAFEGSAEGVDCGELLKESWSKRLSGETSLRFVVDGRSPRTQAHGDLEIRQGVLTALPMLDVLAAYADTRRFRELPLQEARTRWSWQEGEIRLTDLVLASDGLMRLTGELTVRGEELDGVFLLGLAPGALSRIPGVEQAVFEPGENGMLWTTVRLTGTVDRPREDLSSRLIAVAGSRLLERLPENGQQVLKFTQTLLQEVSPDAIQKGAEALGQGTEVIEKTTEVVREVSGLLDGLLGGRKKDKEKEEERNRDER